MQNKKFLITLLTSSRLDYLLLSYNSAINQITNLDYDVIIVVNTKKPEYSQQVRDALPDATVVETESNGYPGKGHNSVLQFFRQNPQYDYLIPIDGDDFLYPFSLKSLEKYMPYNPDILLLPFSDILSNMYNDCLSINIEDKCYMWYNIPQMNLVKSVYEKKLSPLLHPLENINTAGRLVFVSRKALDINIYYQEDNTWFDDVYPFLQLMEAAVLQGNRYNIFFIEECYFYLYNRLNEESATNNFLKKKEENYKDENRRFQNIIRDKFLGIQYWDLSKIPVLKNPRNDFLEEKYDFAKQIVEQLRLPSIPINTSKNHIYQQFLKQYGLPNIYAKPIIAIDEPIYLQ